MKPVANVWGRVANGDFHRVSPFGEARCGADTKDKICHWYLVDESAGPDATPVIGSCCSDCTKGEAP